MVLVTAIDNKGATCNECGQEAQHEITIKYVHGKFTAWSCDEDLERVIKYLEEARLTEYQIALIRQMLVD